MNKINRKNKKGQIQFGESFGILIIIFLVLIIGTVWYSNYQNSQIRELEQKQKEDLSFERYYYIMNLPLIHISQNSDIDFEFSQIGIDTFSKYSSFDKNRDFVIDELGKSLIQIQLFDDDFKIAQNITLYNNTKNIRKNSNVDIFKSLITVINETNKNKKTTGILLIKNFN